MTHFGEKIEGFRENRALKGKFEFKNTGSNENDEEKCLVNTLQLVLFIVRYYPLKPKLV
jgi:hypothetical protein